MNATPRPQPTASFDYIGRRVDLRIARKFGTYPRTYGTKSKNGAHAMWRAYVKGIRISRTPQHEGVPRFRSSHFTNLQITKYWDRLKSVP